MKRSDHAFSTALFSFPVYYYLINSYFPNWSEYAKLLLLSYLVITTAYFSWLPDIDLKIQRKIHTLCKKKGFINRLKCFFTKPFLSIFKHRTYTHSLVVLAVFVALLLFAYFSIPESLHVLFLLVFVPIVFGILFHILEDSFTVRGVPLFYPLSKKSYRLFRFNTNKTIDVWLMRMVVFIIFSLLLLLCV